MQSSQSSLGSPQLSSNCTIWLVCPESSGTIFKPAHYQRELMSIDLIALNRHLKFQLLYGELLHELNPVPEVSE